ELLAAQPRGGLDCQLPSHPPRSLRRAQVRLQDARMALYTCLRWRIFDVVAVQAVPHALAEHTAPYHPGLSCRHAHELLNRNDPGIIQPAFHTTADTRKLRQFQRMDAAGKDAVVEHDKPV